MASDNSKSVTINVDIVLNQAKSALSDIATSTEKATKQLSNLGASANKGAADLTQSIGGASKATSGYFDSQTTSVLKGLAAYDALKKGAEVAFDFLKDSVAASMRASETMAQVQNNVKNAGLSFEDLAPKLKAYSEQMIQLGFDDEDTQLSISKLAVVTGNYSQALKLNQLAMDLARSKNIDLGTATNLVAMVTQGNTKALREYGIGMSETSTIADVLTEAQNKVKDSALAAANTPAGKLRTLQVQWENMQETVGDALVPALGDLYKVIEDNLPAIEALAKGIATVVGVVAQVAGGVVKTAQNIGWGLGNMVNSLQGLPQVQMDVVKSTDAVTTANKDAATSFDGIGKSSKASAQQVQQHEQDMKDLAQAIVDVTQKQQEFSFASVEDYKRFSAVLADTKTAQAQWITAAKQGFDAFQSKIKDVNSSITDLNGKLADAKKAFQDFLASTAKDSGDSFAQIVHDAETSIPDLQKQIQQAINDGQNPADLQKQLADKQSVITTSQQSQYQSNAEFVAQLAFLRSQDGKDELAQAYAVMNQKIDAKKKETDDSIAQIQLQIDAATKERDAFTAAQTIMTAVFQDNIKLRQKSADTEIATLGALTAAVDMATTAYQRMAAAASRSPVPSTSGTSTGRAVGGAVSGGMPYIVGEDGPELFTPNTGGSITPNGKVSAQGGLTVVFNNPQVRSDSDIDAIIEAVEDVFSRRDELARMGTYK